MIQIDDAGSGSFVGGTCIGVYRPETNEYYFDIIPVELYSLENIKEKLYLDEVINIIEKAFFLLDVKSSETIEICRGYMFEKLIHWLNNNGFSPYSTHITGRVQDIVEQSFMLYTVELGLPINYIKYTRFPFHFHKLLRWVFADYENRIKKCKVGWKSWQKLKHIKPDESEGIMNLPHQICLKCGNPIKIGFKIKILKYTSNKENFVYLHRKC